MKAAADILIERKQRILSIVLNRAAKRNALTAEMSRTIAHAIESAQTDDDIGCIIITADGAVFCAGMDLEEAATVDDTSLATAHEALFTIGSRSLKPIVIAVDGDALGGGLGLVAQGHIVFASENAVFGLPEIRVGLWPFLVYRSVSAVLGPRRVLEFSLTGEYFNADQGFQYGLIHRVCHAGETEGRAQSMASHLARASPLAISAGLQCTRDSFGKSWDEAGQIAAALRTKVMQSEDFKEGRLAFKQKREPHWPSMTPGFYQSEPH